MSGELFGVADRWHGKSVKALTSGLISVGRAKLSGLCPLDPSGRWLEMIGDVTRFLNQWRSCISNFFPLCSFSTY